MKRPGRNAEEMRRRKEGPRNKLLPVCCCCHRLRSRLIHDAYSIYTHILCNAQKRIRQEWKCAHKGYATTTNYVHGLAFEASKSGYARSLFVWRKTCVCNQLFTTTKYESFFILFLLFPEADIESPVYCSSSPSKLGGRDEVKNGIERKSW